MKKILLFYFTLQFSVFNLPAQTAKVYRAGALIGTYTNLTAASNIASVVGDSILLSAHTFKEYNIPMKGGQIWQGTITTIDTTIIDAENKGQIGKDSSLAKKNRALTIRDIICINGYDTSMASGTGGGAFYTFKDSLALRGQTIIRNCYAKKTAGGVYLAYAFDKVKISHNHSDSFGGAAAIIFAFDSVEISYNTALYGGAVGNQNTLEGGSLGSYSSGVKIFNNSAIIAGGAVYGRAGIYEGQVLNNQAPVGAAIYAFNATPSSPSCVLRNVKVFNPDNFGNRQVEVLVDKGGLVLNGAWFGKSDTIGLIRIKPGTAASVIGKYAIANWSVNRGKPLTKADTLFPIGAAFTYNDGTALPSNALPWLEGDYSSNTGKLLTPNPKMTPTDTISSLFRTYVYPTKGDTSSKPINFTCIVDGDTFRTSPRVWGIDSIKLSIDGVPMATDIVVYPNPAKDFLNLRNVPDGSQLQLHSLDGKLLLSERSKGTNTVLDIAAFPVGHYLLKVIIADGKTAAVKVQKE